VTEPVRIRVLTPEALDDKSADLVGTSGSALREAILTLTGSSDPGITFTSAATANAGMKRDASGRAQVQDPSANLDIVNKQTLDTAVAARVATTTLGAASGVATLDSTSRLTVSQIPSILIRNQGSGTSLPGSPGRGDVYYHSGVGCLFQYDGSAWVQAGRCTVATRTARNTLSSTYSSLLHEGFLVHQVDAKYMWKMCSDGVWAYAGWSGGGVQGQDANSAPLISFQRVNMSFTSNQSEVWTRVSGWTVNTAANPATASRGWLSLASNGTFTVEDRCTITVIVTSVSNTTQRAGITHLRLDVPGGTSSIPGGSLTDFRLRQGVPFADTFAGSGGAESTITFSGPANADDVFTIYNRQYNPSGVSVNYQFTLAVSISPL
jgi:hypothetical protein